MRRSSQGFTLLEILIAIAIFGMVIGLAYSSYNATFTIINSAEEHTETYTKARITMERIMDDLESFYVGKEMFFKGKRESFDTGNGASLEFTSTAHVQLHPGDVSTGPVIIRYRVEEDPKSDSLLLFRTEAQLLKQDTEEKDNPGLLLCDNLTEVIFSYHDKDGQEKENWGDETDTADDASLPSLINISLRFNDNEEKSAGSLFQTAISLISVLAIITLQFAKNMRQEFIVSASLKNSVRLGEMAKSGVNIAQELLILDLEDNTFDSLFDPWALLADEEFTDLFPLGTLTVDVQDEGGKFQVNAMVIRKREGFKAKNKADDKQQQNHERYVRNILWRLLRAEPFSMEDGDARKIIDALIDWMDTGDGDGEEEYGAEDGYYQSLDPPYSCKNGPIESIEELLLVKGITKELLYGTEEKPPLAPLLTVVNDTGKININTADVLLLQALAPGLDKTTSENMIEFREDEANKTQLEDSNWYKNVPSFPGDIELTKNQISTSSNFFTIRAAAEFNAQQKIITTTVERKDEQIKILRWDSE